MSETSDVVRPLLAALEALGIECHRIHCGKARVRGGFLHLNKPGKPDIGGVLPGGRAFYVEAKGDHRDACKCESCDAQRNNRVKLEAAGALYVFARTPDEGLRGLGLFPEKQISPRVSPPR
jgi:hypothetical protein